MGHVYYKIFYLFNLFLCKPTVMNHTSHIHCIRIYWPFYTWKLQLVWVNTKINTRNNLAQKLMCTADYNLAFSILISYQWRYKPGEWALKPCGCYVGSDQESWSWLGMQTDPGKWQTDFWLTEHHCCKHRLLKLHLYRPHQPKQSFYLDLPSLTAAIETKPFNKAYNNRLKF